MDSKWSQAPGTSGTLGEHLDELGVSKPTAVQLPEALRYILWRYGQDHSGEDHQERLRVAEAWLDDLALRS